MLSVWRTSPARADPLSQVYSTSLAMLVTMALSNGLFGTSLRLPLLLGILTACCSVQLYYMDPASLLAEAQRRAEEARGGSGSGGGLLGGGAGRGGGGKGPRRVDDD